MNDRFQKGEKIGLHTKFALPHDGNSLALSLENERDFWDTGGRLIAIRIAVYNLSSQKRVMVFNVNPLPTTDFDFALSPNGSKLAVLNDRDVSVYAVPTD
jgi:hypothetical protein